MLQDLETTVRIEVATTLANCADHVEALTLANKTSDRNPFPVTREHDAYSLAQAAVPSLPLEILGFVEDAFEIHQRSSDRNSQSVIIRLNILKRELATKHKGSLFLTPYTATNNIDAVRLFYVGLTQEQLTARETCRPTFLHPAFSKAQLSSPCLTVFADESQDSLPSTSPAFLEPLF